MMKLTGTVQDGENNASYWLSKYSEVYQEWTGMKIFPGSLNLQLASTFDWNDQELKPFKRIHSLVPFGGNRDICLIPCEVYKEERNRVYGFAWATTNAMNDKDSRVLEIVTSVRLRDVLQLSNGTMVEIDIPVSWSA